MWIVYLITETRVFMLKSSVLIHLHAKDNYWAIIYSTERSNFKSCRDVTLTQDCQNVSFNNFHSTVLAERVNWFFMISLDQAKTEEKSPFLFYKNCATDKAIENK